MKLKEPTMKALAAPSTRRKRSIESFANAAECIGPIEKDISLFAITRGQFSMLDAVSHAIKQIGPCQISVWTWAIADYEVECFELFMNMTDITGGNLIIDRSAVQRNASLIERWRSIFGINSVRICKNHAKIATVENEKYKILLRGSMNLNFNPRFEQLDITEGGADFALVREIENELPILKSNASNLEAMNATKLGLAYEAGTLNLFGGIKVWQK
jgi:hypothetical protein